MTRRLLGATLVAAVLLPATAHAATLNPLKPCYISVTQRTPGEAPAITREALDLGGSGFTPGALVDVSLDGTLDRTLQADPAGNLPAQVLQSPYRARGEGPFTLTAAEQGNPANAVTLTSRTDRAVAPAAPARGRAVAPDPLHRPRLHRAEGGVGALPATAARSARRSGLVRRIDNACGSFSVRRKQIPVKRPRTGNWTLQVDQQRRYSRAPDERLRPRQDRGARHAGALTGSASAKISSPSATSTSTRSPLEYRPCSSPRASGSTRWRWITRLSGRAP